MSFIQEKNNILIFNSLSRRYFLILAENIMNRKEFFAKVGFGAAAVLVPACLSSIATSCSKSDAANTTPGGTAPVNVDFTIETASGALATNGGFVVSNGVVVARTLSGSFIAVSAACTHKQSQVNYVASTDKFLCPTHGAQFSNTGAAESGPANGNLKLYQTTLTGTNLRVFS